MKKAIFLYPILLGSITSLLFASDFEYAYTWQKNNIGPTPFGPRQVAFESPEHGRATWVPPMRAGDLVWRIRTDKNHWPRINMANCIYTARDYNTHGLWSRRLHHFWTFNTIDFGEIRPVNNAAAPEHKIASADWTHAKLAYPGENNDKNLSVTVSRLTPAILIETSESVELFAGRKEAADFPTAEWRKLSAKEMNAPYKFSYLIHGKMDIRGASGSHLPAHYAVSDGSKVLIYSEIPQKVLTNAYKDGWILCWFGKDSFFYSTRHPLVSTYANDKQENFYKADCPILILFSKTPQSLEKTDDSIKVTFANGGRVVMMPLLGADLPKAEQTAGWADKLPQDIIDKCNFWSQRLGKFPISASESYAVEDEKDTVTITSKFNYVKALDRKSKTFAPVPPMVSVAKKYGFPVKFDGRVVDTGMLTPLGPFEGIENTDSYSYTISGITDLVNRRRVVKSKANEPKHLTEKLNAEIKKILAAGHLRPWMFMQKAVPGWGQPGYPIWDSPGEILYVLAEAYPLLDDTTKVKVVEYMKKSRADYPPEKLFELPFDKGAHRQRHRPPHEKTLSTRPGRGSFLYTAKRDAYKNTGLIPLESLYYLSRYYDLAGAEELGKDYGRIHIIYPRYCKHAEWASLGWYARTPVLTTTYQNVTNIKRKEFPFGGGGVIDTNHAIAGLIGLARMAKMEGHLKDYHLAAGHLAKLAALRCALAHFSNYMYDSNLLEPFEKKGVYGDHFVRTDWSGPLHDNRQVFTLTQFGIDFTCWSDYEWSMNLGTFHGITPESGRLMREHAGTPSKAYLDFIEQNWPDWYMAFSEMFYSHEVTYNQPQDPYNMFMANAWILDAEPEKLEKLIDISWMERGDLYYIMKLAETIKAWRGWEWK